MKGRTETDQRREKGGDIGPFTPIPGAAGGIGRMPVPVAESTRQPGEAPGEGRLDQRGIPSGPMPNQSEPATETKDAQRRQGPEWALPGPSEPCPPPGEDMVRSKAPSQSTEEQEERPP